MFRSGNYFGILTRFLNRILCLALSLFVLVFILRPELFLSTQEGPAGSFVFDYVLAHKAVFACGSFVVLALNLNLFQFIIYSLWNSSVRRYISSTTAAGTARVSLDAIERTLSGAARDLPEITKCKLRVYRIAPKRYKVEVFFWIPGDRNVVNISEKLRLMLKKRFTELVAVEPDERVYFEICLAGIKNRRGRGPFGFGGASKSGLESAQRQFKGPIYPVGGDM